LDCTALVELSHFGVNNGLAGPVSAVM